MAAAGLLDAVDISSLAQGPSRGLTLRAPRAEVAASASRGHGRLATLDRDLVGRLR